MSTFTTAALYATLTVRVSWTLPPAALRATTVMVWGPDAKLSRASNRPPLIVTGAPFTVTDATFASTRPVTGTKVFVYDAPLAGCSTMSCGGGAAGPVAAVDS